MKTTPRRYGLGSGGATRTISLALSAKDVSLSKLILPQAIAVAQLTESCS